jgi:predicted molibdopterin-dependent oxidoreductase YjgC
MAEQITKDLQKAGSEDMGSLIDMLNGYKTREENSIEEIEKLT